MSGLATCTGDKPDSSNGITGAANNPEIPTSEDPNAVDNKIPISPPSPTTNLDRFINSITTSVPAQYFSKTTMRGRRTCDVEYQYYFTLADLWDSLDEWSAYGAGVPLVLNGIYSKVVQYYVPYLSAIQLYGQWSLSGADSRKVGVDSDGDDSRVSSSNVSSDYEVEEGLGFSRLQQTFQLQSSNVSSCESSLSSLCEDGSSQEDFSSDNSETGISHGDLLFQYLELKDPYSREPLTVKIEELARLFTGLNTLKSCDLLPLSWFSVAWYPTCRIPGGPNIKDLDTCFLTFHHLSVPSKGTRGSQSPKLVFPNGMGEIPRFVFNAFGMDFLKFREATWSGNNADSVSSRVRSLTQAADEWIKLVGASHPDFNYFRCRSHGFV